MVILERRISYQLGHLSTLSLPQKSGVDVILCTSYDGISRSILGPKILANVTKAKVDSF